jgi:hypothetical protein
VLAGFIAIVSAAVLSARTLSRKLSSSAFEVQGLAPRDRAQKRRMVKQSRNVGVGLFTKWNTGGRDVWDKQINRS